MQEETSIDSVHNEIMGDLAFEGEIEFEENEPHPIHLVNETPRFKEDKRLSEEKAKTNFQKRMTDFIKINFDNKLSQSLGLRKGKFRIYARFIINDLGKVSDIQVRAPHEVLKKHTKEIIEKLPQFLPAKREGKIVNVSYVLPITFFVDE
ncbi:TonB protein C-terminal [Tenacibaculum sp. MAR_2009_124]|uniref:energy transducer TonB n=1 Tax=Tenacibaculum sp. MAR_2009_124 TaxID=1250059 RepID=UPI00089762E1|nr:energy transducer TonB [Tenacibaculum sp. MAR_2009_124]SEC40341.1 TonB protein C-terminal [Tenacibaculum sp. MAR_2009_124]